MSFKNRNGHKSMFQTFELLWTSKVIIIWVIRKPLMCCRLVPSLKSVIQMTYMKNHSSHWDLSGCASSSLSNDVWSGNCDDPRYMAKVKFLGYLTWTFDKGHHHPGFLDLVDHIESEGRDLIFMFWIIANDCACRMIYLSQDASTSGHIKSKQHSFPLTTTLVIGSSLWCSTLIW